MSFRSEIIENQHAIELVAKYTNRAGDFITLCDGLDVSRRTARNLLCTNATERTKLVFFAWEKQKEHTTMDFINVLIKFSFRELARKLGYPSSQYGYRRLIDVRESVEFRMQLQEDIEKCKEIRRQLAQNIDRLKEKQLELGEKGIANDSLLCCICAERQKTIVLAPCNHLCVCADCAQTLNPNESLCPICRSTVKSHLRVYL